MTGLIAQRQGGANIILEHRHYELSVPFGNLSEASLRYYTLEQVIDDFEYFANNVVLPMPGGDQVKPSQAPWVLAGGSYSGALTAWTMLK